MPSNTGQSVNADNTNWRLSFLLLPAVKTEPLSNSLGFLGLGTLCDAVDGVQNPQVFGFQLFKIIVNLLMPWVEDKNLKP